VRRSRRQRTFRWRASPLTARLSRRTPGASVQATTRPGPNRSWTTRPGLLSTLAFRPGRQWRLEGPAPGGFAATFAYPRIFVESRSSLGSRRSATQRSASTGSVCWPRAAWGSARNGLPGRSPKPPTHWPSLRLGATCSRSATAGRAGPIDGPSGWVFHLMVEDPAVTANPLVARVTRQQFHLWPRSAFAAVPIFLGLLHVGLFSLLPRRRENLSAVSRCSPLPGS